MGKLIRFELKKMAGNRFFLIALCLMLLLDLLLLGGLREWLDLQTAIEEGTLMEGSYGPEDETFLGSMASNRRAAESIRTKYRLLTDLSEAERDAFQTAMNQKYGFDIQSGEVPELTDEILSVPGYLGGRQNDLISILDYQAILSWNTKSETQRERVIRAAESFAQDAAASGDAYALRRNQNIIRLYSIPRKEITSQVVGWQEFLFDTPTMALISLLVLLACAGIVSDERSKGTWAILHTAKNGKGKTLAAKYCAGAITAAMATVMLQAASLGAIWFKGGLLGAAQPVTSVQELGLCPYPFTVWQYALLFLGCQVFSAVILSILWVTISALCKSSIFSYGIGAVFLGISLALCYSRASAGLLSGPLAMAQPLKYFSGYVTGNLFGFPVLRLALHGLFWVAFSGGAVALAHFSYRRKRGRI